MISASSAQSSSGKKEKGNLASGEQVVCLFSCLFHFVFVVAVVVGLIGCC